MALNVAISVVIIIMFTSMFNGILNIEIIFHFTNTNFNELMINSIIKSLFMITLSIALILWVYQRNSWSIFTISTESMYNVCCNCCACCKQHNVIAYQKSINSILLHESNTDVVDIHEQKQETLQMETNSVYTEPQTQQSSHMEVDTLQNEEQNNQSLHVQTDIRSNCITMNTSDQFKYCSSMIQK
eukprot:135004_1